MTNTWLYILFVHAFTELSAEESFALIETNFLDFQHCDSIKLVIIKNSFTDLRTMTESERAILTNASENTPLRLCISTIYTGEKSDVGKIKFISSNKKFNYWQKAFDYVLKTYAADNYILYTYSHSNGFQIGAAETGFVLNSSGRLMHRKHNIPAHQPADFKKYFYRISNERKNKFFFKGLSHTISFKNKSYEILHPVKLHIKKWPDTNSTNGILVYDLAEYLRQKKITFRYIFLHNCAALLLENIYHFNSFCEVIMGSAGNISKGLDACKRIYASIELNSNLTNITDSVRQSITNSLKETGNSGYKILMVKTEKFKPIMDCFTRIISRLNLLYTKNSSFNIHKLNMLSPEKEHFISPNSNDDLLQHYDFIELLTELAHNDSDTVILINNLKGLCKMSIFPLHNPVIDDYPSILFPYKHRYTFLSHLRSIFRKPENSFSDLTGYNKLIATIFLE
ncbi:hypothetical protein [Ferruginibacter sp. SUN106]|uniref:hypothetical protein n=1 Tax=Ferruginibacter sp. SUN106 TaxID=2978348 RepID=UPI003D362993